MIWFFKIIFQVIYLKVFQAIIRMKKKIWILIFLEEIGFIFINILKAVKW